MKIKDSITGLASILILEKITEFTHFKRFVPSGKSGAIMAFHNYPL